MNATEILSSLGFENAAVVNEQRGKIVVRVRTSNGWVYEKFDKDNLHSEMEAWAAGRSPE